MQTEHYVMNEKYRPSTLEGYVCEDTFKQKVEGWIEQQNIPHLFLYGKPGSGKTTLAKIIARNIDCDYIMINATDKRGIEDIKNEILPFVSVIKFIGFKKSMRNHIVNLTNHNINFPNHIINFPICINASPILIILIKDAIIPPPFCFSINSKIYVFSFISLNKVLRDVLFDSSLLLYKIK